MIKMKTRLMMMLFLFTLFIGSTMTAYATDLDSLVGGEQTVDTDSSQVYDGDEGYSAVTDYLKGYNYTTPGQMQKASTFASPITNAIGTVTGFLVMITAGFVGLITAVDLLYIAVPPIRSFLNPNMNAGAGATPAGGMMGGGMMGGMRGGFGGMGGMHQPGAMSVLRRCWVSDEAVACVNMANAQNQPAPSMGGMGMGMGGMGMGMGAQAAPQPQNTKSVIGTYLKKRAIFVVLFAIATALLLSSLFSDCGLNLAQLLYKVISKFSAGVSNANI